MYYIFLWVKLIIILIIFLKFVEKVGRVCFVKLDKDRINFFF